jgi:hypothetical protein
MEFHAIVEAPEPMMGLEIPVDVVESLEGGKRPNIVITLNAHTWRSRVAILRGRHLIGRSNANRRAAGVATGEHVIVRIELDTEPRVAVEPADFEAALQGDALAKAAYDAMSTSRQRECIRSIDSAKKPETRMRRIQKVVNELRTAASTPPPPM